MPKDSVDLMELLRPDVEVLWKGVRMKLKEVGLDPDNIEGRAAKVSWEIDIHDTLQALLTERVRKEGIYVQPVRERINRALLMLRGVRGVLRKRLHTVLESITKTDSVFQENLLVGWSGWYSADGTRDPVYGKMEKKCD